MRDGFEFESPLGSLGWIVDSLFLTSYMRRFLVTRISQRLPLPPGVPQQVKSTPSTNSIMNTSLTIYTAYFLVSLGMTIWVARTLHKNGRLFLVEAFAGNQEMADSVNHLLWVGFYLINLGFILLFLRVGPKPADIVEGVEYISTKLGIVMLVLGGMHFFNMFNFARMRKKGLAHRPPPIPPQPPGVLGGGR